jgi:hypothetical protein
MRCGSGVFLPEPQQDMGYDTYFDVWFIVVPVLLYIPQAVSLGRAAGPL